MRAIRPMLLVAGALLGVAGAAAAAGGGASSDTARKVQCKLTGVHYVGTTAQKQKACLTVSANRRVLRQYSFGGRSKCTDGSRDLGLTDIKPNSTSVSVGELYVVSVGAGETETKISDVAKDGRFDGSIGLRATGATGWEIEVTFSGQIKSNTVTGVLGQRVKFGDPASPDVVCNMAKTRWSARRTAK